MNLPRANPTAKAATAGTTSPSLEGFRAQDLPIERIEDDRLDIKPHAEALANFVRQCDTPMTIGIQGEWGSGKTSLMRMVTCLLDDLPVLPFEAWQYGALGHDDRLGLWFMQQMVEEVGSQLETHFAQKSAAEYKQIRELVQTSKSMVGRFFKSVAGSAITSASGGALDGSAIIESTLGEGQSFAEPGTTQGVAQSVSRLKRQFGELTQKLIDIRQSDRFVILVDDLDRVRPAQAVALLEVLKNFADVRDCVFIVACDYKVVEAGVKDRLGITEDKKVKAFFDKIIQVPFRMPQDAYELRKLLQAFLERKGSVVDDAVLGHIARMVNAAMGPNPRAIKRFLNAVHLHSYLPINGRVDFDWKNANTVTSALVLNALQYRFDAIASVVADAAKQQDPEQFRKLLDRLESKVSAADDDLNDGQDDLGERVSRLAADDKDALAQFGAALGDLIRGPAKTLTEHLKARAGLLSLTSTNTDQAAETKSKYLSLEKLLDMDRVSATPWRPLMEWAGNSPQLRVVGYKEWVEIGVVGSRGGLLSVSEKEFLVHCYGWGQPNVTPQQNVAMTVLKARVVELGVPHRVQGRLIRFTHDPLRLPAEETLELIHDIQTFVTKMSDFYRESYR